MAEELKRTLREVRDKLLSEPVSPRVTKPADINLRYCQYVAEEVVDRLDDDVEVEILEDGGYGFAHTWIAHNGLHYDAECVEGVSDYRDLPFFQRHPEAAIHVEFNNLDRAALRHRWRKPFYPNIYAFNSVEPLKRISTTTYWIRALASLLLGGLLLVLGLSGEWALHQHLIHQSATMRTLFIDLEIIGELILLITPLVFFVLLPAPRADSA